MRPNTVFCDVCSCEAPYNSDYKRPYFVTIKTEKIYETFKEWGYIDFCEGCFDECTADIEKYMSDRKVFLPKE